MLCDFCDVVTSGRCGSCPSRLCDDCARERPPDLASELWSDLLRVCPPCLRREEVLEPFDAKDSDLDASFGQPVSRQVFCRHINLLICYLSWLHLGRPAAAVEECRAGRTLTPQQWGIVAHLERGPRRWLQYPSYQSSDLGRAAAKYDNISEVILSLESEVSALQVLLDPYSNIRGRRSEIPRGRDAETQTVGRLPRRDNVAAKDIDADRLKLGSSDPPQFHPRGLLPE